MIIDFHTHLFPREIREERGRFFSGEPAFQLLYDSDKSPLAGAADILRDMDADGVHASVVFGFPWLSKKLFQRHNDYILEKAAAHPDRLYPLACFDVLHPDAAKEAERCLSAGAKGLGELALYKSGIDEEGLKALDPVMEVARAHGNAPVLIHVNEPVGHVYPGKTPVTPDQVWNLLFRYPENRIVLAHWGGGIFFFHLLKRLAKDAMRNAWLDTAASPFLYDPRIWSVACAIVGPSKVLFGTDYPLLKARRYWKELESTDLSAAQQEAILGENARALLGIR
ncbi:MAG: amidohydrolase [Deltaproteobacteria bacterium]|nr:amidohydrolase [Deltaproteobacteria bacterium]